MEEHGTRCFQRSFASYIPLRDAIKALNVSMANPRVIRGHSLLRENPMVYELRKNEKLVVYDDPDNDHDADRLGKEERFEIQLTLHQALTGYPRHVSRCIISMTRINQKCSGSVWTESLPSTEHRQIAQKYRDEFVDGVRDQKVSVRVHSPCTTRTVTIAVHCSDSVGRLRRKITKRMSFECRQLMLFAVTDSPSDDMENVDGGNAVDVQPINDEDGLPDILSVYKQRGFQFFQLRNQSNSLKLSMFPIHYDKRTKPISTSMVAIPILSAEEVRSGLSLSPRKCSGNRSPTFEEYY